MIGYSLKEITDDPEAGLSSAALSANCFVKRAQADLAEQLWRAGDCS